MTSGTRPPVSPVVGIIVGLAAVSSSSILIKLAQREAPSLVIAAARLTLASIILVPLVLARYHIEYRKLTRGEGWLAVFSGIFLALHFATWISSLEYTTVASSIVLVSASPAKHLYPARKRPFAPLRVTELNNPATIPACSIPKETPMSVQMTSTALTLVDNMIVSQEATKDERSKAHEPQRSLTCAYRHDTI